ncbi:MAG: hypothetical protein FWC19_03965 [Treponema sp.]|nr:hypothetical protein [Treponema sp.]
MKKYLFAVILACMFLSGCTKEDRNGIPGKQALIIDIELTAFSATMAHSMLVDMLTNPENYLGKTVKTRGEHTVLYYTPERPYNFIIVDGPPDCCPQALMFMLKGERVYPQEGKRIEITGVFSRYDGFELPYYYLAVNDIIILD